MKVVIIGPAHPLRGGGITTFNHRLARQFQDEGNDTAIVSFSLQYPGFLFPGTTQYSNEPAPQDITIYTWINSVNPLNWLSVGRRLRKMQPDIIVVRFWIPLMGPALGSILRIAKKNKKTKVVCIADNIIPHEKRPGDAAFTRYFLKACDAFVTMSDKVLGDLRLFEKSKPVQLVRHPLYDNFGAPVTKEAARKHLGLFEEDKIILFFGFIRRYKGLDLLLQAMAEAKVKDGNIKLLIAGEFYEDEAPYMHIIQENKLEENVILRTHFIPDSEVKYYLCAADCVVQPYRNATQSGVTPLAYHFEKPMIVTNVGGLPALVPHQKVGLVCEPDPASIAEAIQEFYSLGPDYFLPHLHEEKQNYDWSNITKAITNLARE